MKRKLDIASTNVALTRGNILLDGGIVCVFQYGRDLEGYMEEFQDICFDRLIQPHLTDVTQPDPEYSPPTPLTMEKTMPEPPADGELLPIVRMEPVMTVPTNAPDLKPQCESDQE
ncbi:hypothetical protein M9458_039646 [Cirrhinus mrigala]|uniref:Uncharacterized protein n=1 Tax=Cirrhinus mrigala TaxID=683832 RepID=A0ABD0NTY5_CIRMR